MAIVQISQIIHRTGSIEELPKLEIGEIGFASDERRVFIGNDLAMDGNDPRNTEILTNSPNCKIDFSQGSGSLNLPIDRVSITGGSDGQVLTTDGTGNVSWSDTPSISGFFTMHANANGVYFTETSSGNVYHVTMNQI